MVGCLPCSFGQLNDNVKQQLLDAESSFLYEEFNEALPVYMKLKDRYPDNYYLDYKIGRCYLNIPFDRQKSLIYLKLASNSVKISKTNKDGSFKENEVPLDVIFYLGDAYRINNQLDKSIEKYQEFKNKADKKIYDLKLVDNQIQACKRAIIMEKRPVDISIQNLGKTINTKYSEIHPVISEDENILLYAAQLPFYQAVFYTKKTDGVWQQPVNIITDLGIDGDCLPTSISADGREAYFYRSDEFRGDLYVSNFINGKWTKIRKLNDNINTRYWESHASLSHDGKTLYFTSNRPGGMGGLDIYKTQRTSGDNWGPAQNLGPVINSSYNEDAPFITADDKRLYFSSFGHETMGGFDIFYSDKDANGNWTKPVNIGYPVNTTGDEMFFCPAKNGTVGYFSEIDSTGFGKYDIVRVEIFDIKNPRLYKISGNIKTTTNGNNQKILMIVLDQLSKDTIYNELLTGEDFNFKIKAGNYEIYISASGYQSQILPFSITPGSKDFNRVLNTLLVAVNNQDNTASGITAEMPVLSQKQANNGKLIAGNEINKNSPGTNLPAITSKVTKNTKISQDQNDIHTTIKTIDSNKTLTKNIVSKVGFWKSVGGISWEYYSVPCALAIFVIVLVIIKKRRNIYNK